MVLKAKFGDGLKTEFKGITGRRFKFDWAVPEINLAIEYEGLMSFKSRHTTVTGYTNDTTKYNLAQLQGWRVLRYTQLNYGQIVDDLEKLQ